MSQVFILFAGLYGAAGVGLAAAAAHLGGTGLASASQMLLFHAPVLLVLGLVGRTEGIPGWLFPAGGIIILAGVALFSGDLALKAFREQSLFRMAAPSGGMLMIAGWIVIGIAGLFLRR